MPRVSRTVRAAAATVVVLIFVLILRSRGATSKYASSNSARRRAIEAAFDHAWKGYSAHCMGHDSLQPVSDTCNDDFGGWGATTVDALSTAILMGKRDVVMDGLKFVETLDFTSVKGGQRINLFEVTIRHLGGMISAWELLNGPFKSTVKDPRLLQVLYSKMVVLGNALACGFDTRSGIPLNWVDPVECNTDDGHSNTLAGAGSLILEFSKLSEITGDDKYFRLARQAQDYLIDPRPAIAQPFPGLLGSFIGVDDGNFLNSQGSWGSLSDSFYEYLLKAYIYDRRAFPSYLERWHAAADSTILFVGSHPYGHPEWTLLPYWEGVKTTHAMDALSWFAGGSFILGGMFTGNETLLNFGLSIAETGGALYSRTATGLGGEFVWWTENCDSSWGEDPCTADNSVRLSTLEFNLRPEVIETWYYAYRATKKEKYREWAWAAFLAMEKVCKTKSGYSAISDVTKLDGGEKLDKMESFLFAEVFKYLWLMFADVGAFFPGS